MTITAIPVEVYTTPVITAPQKAILQAGILQVITLIALTTLENLYTIPASHTNFLVGN